MDWKSANNYTQLSLWLKQMRFWKSFVTRLSVFVNLIRHLRELNRYCIVSCQSRQMFVIRHNLYHVVMPPRITTFCRVLFYRICHEARRCRLMRHGDPFYDPVAFPRMYNQSECLGLFLLAGSCLLSPQSFIIVTQLKLKLTSIVAKRTAVHIAELGNES